MSATATPDGAAPQPAPHAGRVALVTGGGRGIGRAIVLRLAAGGADVAVNYRRDEAAARQTAEAVCGLGRVARVYRGSVDRWDDDVAMADAVLADFGRVDILVHNGGIASRGLAVADTEPDEVGRVVGTHALGPFYLSKLLVPQMRKADRGDVVFISSVAAEQFSANGAPYTMGKAAEEALARTLAREEQAHGIHVNIVAPGLIATDMGDRLARAVTGGRVGQASDLDEGFPFGRVGRPDDVAAVVDFLVGPGGAYLSGQRIVVDGGGAPLA